MERAAWTGATPRVLRSRAALVAGSLAAGAALAVAAYVAQPQPGLRPWPVLGLWVASIALVVTGAGALEGRQRRTWRVATLPHAELALVAALTLGALLLRVVGLATVPDNFAGDEAESADVARAVLHGEMRDPFSTGWAGHPTVWFFLQAASLGVFGDSVVGARMLSALLGTAAVPVTYLFARRAYGRAVAGVAALLLATWHFHVHYSRIGVNSVGDPLLALLALVLLVAGLRRASPLLLALAGAAAGIAQHFYLGSRLIPLVVAAVVVHQLLFNRDATRAAVRYVPLAAFSFLVAYGPGLRVPLDHWNDYNARLREVGVFQSGWYDARRAQGDGALELLWQQLNASIGAFTHVADNGANYLPGMPLLDTVSAALFVVGLALALPTWRRPDTAALLILLAGTVMTGGVLVVDSPQSHRYVIATPVVSVLVALAVVRVTEGAASVAGRPRAAPTAGAVVAAALALWSVNFYFREFTPRHQYGSRQAEEITELARYLDRRAEGSFVYFFGAPATFLDVGTVRFLAPDVVGTDVHVRVRRLEQLPPQDGPGRPLFVFLPGRLGELAVVRTAYPAGVLRTVRSKADGTTLFAAYEPTAAPR